MARFVICDPKGQTQIFEIGGPTVNIGRAESNDLVLAHASVSRYHARLSVLGGEDTLVTDLGSTNGTFVNGRRIQEHRLRDQDRMTIGMYELRYEVVGESSLHAEAGSYPSPELTGLVGSTTLTMGLRPTFPQGVPISPILQDRLTNLERENELLKLLLAVGKTLSSVLTPDEIMRRVMELVFQMENVERGFVMLRDEKKRLKPAVLLYKDERLKAMSRSLVLSETIINRVLTERVPLLIHDVASDQRFSASESLRLAGVRCAMCAPLIYEDKVFGLFYVDCLSKPWAFSKQELNIFSVIAAEAAISLESARSHEELQRRALERQALERFLSSPIVEKILANPDQVHLGGENQAATVLFSDIRGFTRLAEQMEPQQVVELLNDFFTEMTELVFETGGTLDKYLGDGIMAVFGAPIPRPDDALRAVRTAVEMQRSLAALNKDWARRKRPPLQIGIGISSGQVTAGNIGSSRRMDYTVIGDTVNLASRLCTTAAGGQILISGSTYRELKESWPARKLDPIRVKGKEAPVEVYEIQWE